METFNLPKYSKAVYQLQPEGVYYAQTAIELQETPVERLLKEMRVAPTGAAQIKPNADKMLLDRLVKGKHQFRTGIQRTNYSGWYLGNDYEFYRGEKVTSIILFRFTCHDTAIEVYYFYRYDKANNFYRMQFAHNAIPFLSNNTENKAA